MRINSVIVSENISNLPMPNNENKVIIVQPLLSVRVPFIPTQLSFHFAIGLLDVEVNKEQKVTLVLSGPDEVECWKTEMPFVVAPDPNGKNNPNSIIHGDFRNIAFLYEGEYTLRAILENGESASYKFMLIKE